MSPPRNIWRVRSWNLVSKIATIVATFTVNGTSAVFENIRLIPDTRRIDALIWSGEGLVPSTLNNFDNSFSASDEWNPDGYTGPTLYGVTKTGSCWVSLRNPTTGLDRIRLNDTDGSAVDPSGSAIVLFKKTDFTDVLQDGDRLTFSVDDRLEGTFFDETQAAAGGESVRWVVRNGKSTYYISEPTTTFGTVESPTVLSQSPLALDWFEYDPDTDISSGGIGPAVTPVFDDIFYIGFQLEANRVGTGQLRVGATDLCFDVTISNLPPRLNPLPAAQDRLSDGLLDVTKAPYFADNTGATDARQAIQDAIDDAYRSHLVVFFPSGTYLCDGPLTCIQGEGPNAFSQRRFAHKLVGSVLGPHPVLRLADGADLSAQSDLFLRFAWIGDANRDGIDSEDASRHYCATFRGIDIDMGNNPTASGVRMDGAQYCVIEDTHIYGADFDTGIKGLPGSGGSATNLKVTGGRIGISETQYRPTPLLTGLELVGQSERGISLGICRGALVVAGFRIEGPASPDSSYAAVYANTNFVGGGGLNPSVGNLVLIDGSIEVAGTDGVAIYNRVQDAYLQNVFVKAVNVMDAGSLDAPADTITGSESSWTEFVRYAFGCLSDESQFEVDGTVYDTTADDQELALLKTGTTPPPDLVSRHFWSSGFPHWEEADLLRVTDPEFGATPDDDSNDDAPAIQAALDASAMTGGPHEGKTVFVPRGIFHIRSPIVVPLGANLIGAAQTFSEIRIAADWAPAGEVAAISTEDGVGDVNLGYFRIQGHKAKVETATEAHASIVNAEVRSSNTTWRNVQNHLRSLGDGDQVSTVPCVRVTGNGGGRLYNLQVDAGGGVPATYRHFQVKDTPQTVAVYAPSIEHMEARAPQVDLVNCGKVSLFGFKYESNSTNPWMLNADRVNGLHVYGGSGNYGASEPTSFITLDRCFDVRLASLSRQDAPDPTLRWITGQGLDVPENPNICYIGLLEDLDEDGIADVSTPVDVPLRYGGGRVSSTLSPGDTHTYTFTLSAPGNIRIETVGDTDTVGVLKDAFGAVLNDINGDDDGGDGTNFLILQNLPAGTYIVQVTGGPAAPTGDFEFRVIDTGVFENWVVADYRDDFQLGTFPPGWSYLWNEFGEVEDPANYSPLETDGSTWDTDSSNPGIPDPAPGVRCHLSATGGHPGSSFPDRYAIAAFQVAEDGSYAIADSFLTLTNSSSGGSEDGVIVQVRVSGESDDRILRRVYALETKDFDGYLGDLSAGDTIYVCVGENGTHLRDNFDFDFSIVELDEALGELEFPVNGDDLISFNPNFLWQEEPFGCVGSVDHYEIQVAEDENFTQIAIEDSSVLARYASAGLRLGLGTTYYWRVRCIEGGTPGDWSQISKFSVANFEEYVVTIDASHTMQEVRDAFDLAKANAPATVRLTEDVSWEDETMDVLIPLDTGYDHIWFDGNGKNITITRPNNGLSEPRECKNLIFTDFSVDYDPLPYVLCEVTELDPVNNRFTVRTINNAANPSLEINDPLMLAAEKQHMFIRDPALPGKGRHGATGTFLHPSRQDYHSTYTGGDGNLYHVIEFVSFHTTDEVEVGDFMVRVARGGKQLIRSVQCEDFCLNNVVAYSSPGQFASSIGGTRSAFLNCGVDLKPGRYLSVTADCVYVRRNEIGPWVENCRFTANGDDCMNFHTIGSQIHEVVDPQTLKLEALGEVRAYDPGDAVVLWDGFPGTDNPVYTTVTSVDEAELTVTFADPVGTVNLDNANHEMNSLLYNITKNNRRFVVKDTIVTDGKRYGLMIPSENGAALDNVFRGGRQSGLMIATRPSEGFGGKGILARGNRFENLGHRSEYFDEGRGAITIDSLGLGWRHTPQRFNSDIKIIDNQIIGWNYSAFHIRSCFDVLIDGNYVSSGGATDFSPFAATNHLVVVGNTDNVTFTNNVLDDTRTGASAIDDEGDNTNLIIQPFSTDFPEIEVEQPVSNGLTDGASDVDFGNVEIGSSVPFVFTIRNSGTLPLTDLAATIAGSDGPEFSAGAIGATTLAPGASTTLTITFSPSDLGPKDAALQIASNDYDENPFDIDLSGTCVEMPPSTPDLDAGSDSGAATDDNLTNVIRPTFTGTSRAGVVVAVTSDVNGELGTATADNSGNWSVTAGLDLTEGSHEITATAGTSEPSAALSLVIDTSAPTAPSAPDLDAGSDSGSINTDNVTSDNTPTFSGTASADTVTVTLFAGAVEVGSINSDSPWSITSNELSDDTHTITAKATDLAGNESASSTGPDVTIDTSPPTLTFGKASGQADPASSGPVLFTATFNENVSGFDEADVTVGGSAGGTDSVSGGPSVYTVSVTATTSEGTVTASVGIGIAMDLAGNTSAAPTLGDTSVSLDIHGNNGGSATSLNFSGDAASADGFLEPSDTDVFAFTLTEPSTVTIQTTGTVDTRGALFTDSGAPINTPEDDRDAGIDENFRIEEILPPGTYHVFVSSEGSAQTGAYALSITKSAFTVILNEVDPLSQSGDTREFIELFDGGAGSTSLDGLVLVLFDGATDTSYHAIDLDGESTDANGYFVVGNAGTPNVDLTFPDSTIENGADAVALFAGDTADFPNGIAVTTLGLLDAIVHDTGQADDSGLLALLNTSEPQLDESANANAAGHSLQRIPNGSGGVRNTSAYSALSPTPGEANGLPSAPSALDLHTDSDSGDSQTDDLTNDDTPTITGTARPGSLVTLTGSVDGTIGSGVAETDGSWSITASALSEGAQDITASADGGSSSGALSLTIDTIAPFLPHSLGLLAASDSGVFNNDDITNDNTPSIAGDAEPDTSVTLTSDLDGDVGSGPFNSANAPWIITASTLRDGTHSLTATSIDLAGNQSETSTAFPVTIDTSGPVPSVEKAVGQDDPAASGPVFFTVDFGEEVDGFESGDVSAGGPAAGAVTVSEGLSEFTFEITTTATEGFVTASVAGSVVTDVAGNPNGASTTTDNRVDLDAHGSDSGSATPLSLDSGSAMFSGFLHSGDTDTFSFTLSATRIATLFTTGNVDTRGTLRDSGGTIHNDPVIDDDAGTDFNFRSTATLAAGDYTIEVSSLTDTGDYLLHLETEAPPVVTPPTSPVPDPNILLKAKLSKKMKKTKAALKKAKKSGNAAKAKKLKAQFKKLKKAFKAL